MKRLTKIDSYIAETEYFEGIGGEGRIRICFLTEDIIRVRVSFEAWKPDRSYVLTLTAWPDQYDELLREERKRVRPAAYQLTETAESYCLQGGKLRAELRKEPFQLRIFDAAGHLLHSDIAGRSYEQDKNGGIRHYSAMNKEDCFYGFGEKSGELNKRFRRFKMDSSDTLGYDGRRSDPLYKQIPFGIRLDSHSRIASGIFYHTLFPAEWDLGAMRSAYWQRYSSFTAEAGECDWYFINGPQLADVLRNYTELTGRSVLLPGYAYGYLGSTMYYTELDQNSDQAVLDFANKAKKLKMPCSGFHLSSGYTSGSDGKRYVFCWNYKRFPQPEQWVSQMRRQGVEVCPNIKPGMLLTHPLYREFADAGAYILNPQGNQPYTYRFWGGEASFVDFTNPKARALWTVHMREQLLDKGITGVWNDNNEYELNEPDALCCGEGEPERFHGLRAIMPNLMAYTAYQAIAASGRRPFILNRAGFAGIQRYAQTWSGDNHTDWESLKYSIPIILGMSLSGVANQGGDIGGFDGPMPEAELFLRWVQVGCLLPRFSIHSCNTDNTVTEPWSYPSLTAKIAKFFQLRESLRAYLYSLAYQASISGEPIVRPLVYEYQEDSRTWDESFHYLCGSFLLVAPVVEKGQKQKEVYLPTGEWYEWESVRKWRGGQTIVLPVELESLPLFIRSGSIIPIEQSKADGVKQLRFLAEPWNETEFTLYQDDEVSLNYQTGKYRLTWVHCRPKTDYLTIEIKRQGDYLMPVGRLEWEILCRDKAPLKVRVAGQDLVRFLDKEKWEAEGGFYFDAEKNRVWLAYEDDGGDYTIDIDFQAKDLISI